MISEENTKIIDVQTLLANHIKLGGTGTHPEKLSPVPMLNQMYRLADENSFPIGPYILKKTGRPITHSQIYDDTSVFDFNGMLSLLNELGYQKIYDKEHRGLRVWKDLVYELEGEVDGLSTVYIADYDTGEMPPTVQIELDDDTFMDIPARGAGVRVLSNEPKNFVELVKQIEERKLFTQRKPEPNYVGLIVKTNHGYDTMPFKLPTQTIDIRMNYGDAFEPIHDKIISTLNQKNGKGLVLLHGTPGTGKTHYLKYLASQISGKRILFVPPYLVDFITSPEMTPFLIHNSNTILFIEDAERVITDRNENGSTGVANILNLTDGILSDILNIQIVATFNMDKHKIDKALLRKGRLIAEHQFDKLSLEDTNRLIRHLNFGDDVDTGMTLTEIYNMAEVEYKSEEPVKRSVGF